jgi:hypothetical protein
MLNRPPVQAELLLSITKIGNRDEMAWHILDFGLMHDPAYADAVAIAASGDGEHSKLLRAMIGHPDEPDIESTLPFDQVDPPMPAEPYRSSPLSRREQMGVNPFFRFEATTPSSDPSVPVLTAGATDQLNAD